MDNVLEILKGYCDFSDPEKCYILAMFPRKKDNPDNGEREKIKKTFRYILSSVEDCENALAECSTIASIHPKVVFRLYLSVNRRSLVKALREFQKSIADIQYGLTSGNFETYTTIRHLSSEWKSILLKKECRADRNFLFDIDFKNDTEDGKLAAEQLRDDVSKLTTVKYFGKSKNGFCMISEPFNYIKLKLPENVEIKTDEYLYLTCLFNMFK